jgi:hypothetical protein
MKLTLADSVFKEAPIVSVAAKPGGSEVDEASSPVGKFGLSHFTYYLLAVLTDPEDIPQKCWAGFIHTI